MPPPDPRSESPSGSLSRPVGNGQRPKQKSPAKNGARAAGKGGNAAAGANRSAGKNGAARGGQAAKRKVTHRPVAVDPLLSVPPAEALVAEPTPDDTGELAEPTFGLASPIHLPTIVPAEPDEPLPPPAVAESDTADGLGDVDGAAVALVETAPALLPPPALPAELPTELPTESVEALLPSDTDGTGGLPSLTAPKKPPRKLRKPVVVPRTRRPRVRRVTRVVRHVDTWSVFKVAIVFHVFLYATTLTAGVLIWQVAQNTGTVDNVERFFESNGWETFELKGGEIYHNAWILGLFVIVGLTGLTVLAATLFNLITDLVGGIRVSVLEEEVIAREERGVGWRRRREVPARRRRTDFAADEPGAPAADAGTPPPSEPAPEPTVESAPAGELPRPDLG